MVGKSKKRPPPKQKGLPTQEVPPRRRTESPSRRSPGQTNSPQAGNEGVFGNSNVLPNDQSLDSQANHDVASDSVVPGFVADEDVTEQLAQPDYDSLDTYAVLGVPEQATNRQIKKTFHKLSKQYHPDRLTLLPNQQDAHNIFTLISNAYKVLMDPDKRREHDLILRSFHTAVNNASNNVK
jgi:hypothetical protein